MDNQLADFKPGDVVLHVFHCRYATVEKVGRKYLTCRIHLNDQSVKWLASSVSKQVGPNRG